MKAKLPMIARILLGLIFTGAGIAGLIGMIKGTPPPEGMSEQMLSFMNGMTATTYFMPFLKVTETVCGLLLLAGMFVPLSLVVLAPIILNIFFVHAFMDPANLPLPIVIGLLEIYLSFFAAPYSHTIKGLFKRK